MTRAKKTADPPTQQEIEERYRLLKLFRDTKNQRYLAAAEQLHRGDGPLTVLEASIAKSHPPIRPGPRLKDDADLVQEMAADVLHGVDVEVAARAVAPQASESGTEASRAKRLAKKYRAGRKMIEAMALLQLDLKQASDLKQAVMKDAKAWAVMNVAARESTDHFKHMTEAMAQLQLDAKQASELRQAVMEDAQAWTAKNITSRKAMEPFKR